MYAFDEATLVRPHDSIASTYTAELLQGWCIGQVPHGGYLISVLLRAMIMHSQIEHKDLGQTDPIQLHVAFIIKAQTGPARITVSEVKIGRGYSNYKLTLQQQDGDRWLNLIHATGIMGTFSKETGPSMTTTSRVIPEQNDCVEQFPTYTEFRKVANNFQYWEPKSHTDPATEEQWLGFKDGRPMDVLAIGLISDLMTPLPLRVLPNERGWYPTLTLDLQFNKAPKEGGMFTYLEVESESIHGGRFDITTRCYDEDKSLILKSQHVALMVSAARNLSKRGTRSKV